MSTPTINTNTNTSSTSTDTSLLSDLTQSFLVSLRSVAATYQHRVLSSGKQITPQQMMESAQLAVARMMETTYSEVSDLPRLLSTTNVLPLDPHRKKIRCYVDGCFDIMHSGHYNAIRQAKALCDVLVVGVHSDAEILKHKGPPVMNEKERMATVEACKWADEVVFDTPYDPTLELLDRLNCDFCVHGDDMPSTADGKEAYGDVKAAGRMKIIKRTEGVSTTDLVGRLLLMTKEHHIKSPELVSISPVNSPTRGGGVASSHVLPHLQLESSVLASPSPIVILPMPTPSPSPQPANTDQHYAAGISNFLPTTWRITQFSNNRTPTSDDRVVYIDGAFDLFHIGHIETLKKAKALGTFLYVGVHDDTTVNRYKGRNYPIMNLHERVMNVLSCKYVDEVIIGAPWVITKDMITSLNIHVIASGSNTKMDLDHPTSTNTEQDDPYTAAKAAAIFKVIDISHTLQTEDVVTRIIDNRLKYENRNANRSKKELNYLTNKVHVKEV